MALDGDFEPRVLKNGFMHICLSVCPGEESVGSVGKSLLDGAGLSSWDGKILGRDETCAL